MKLRNLKVDNMITPLGIDNGTPRFSWMPDEKQVTYRILVSLYGDGSAAMGETLWDSGIVDSDESVNIAYEGRALSSLTRYSWTVIVNGGAGESSWFETAYLNPAEEFKAHWIGQPFGFAGTVDDIRLDIDIDKPVKSARFYAAVLGTGKVYLNGVLLDDGYFDGGISTYSKKIFYRTYALPLEKGRNVLGIRVGYGFYGAKKIYGMVRVEYADGSVAEMPTIPGRIWNTKKDPVRLNGIYDGEVYDARCEDGWMEPDYKVTYGNWVATFAVDPPSGALKAVPIPPMRIVSEFSPKSVTEKENGFMIDTGVNVCGFLSVRVTGERGAKLTFFHAERLRADGGLDNANYRAAECKDIYILKGGGEERYIPEFTYHGFQYAEIKVEGSVKILDIKVNYLRTDVEMGGEFECSDETLNRLHGLAVQTEGNNLNGTFTDCPQRDERLGWLNDLSGRLYQSVNNYMLENYLPNFVDMITDAQDAEGVIPDTVPYAVGCTVADPVAAYTLAGDLAYQYYNDRGVIERNYRGFAKWIDYLKRNADANGGVVSYGYYGDWCPAAPYANGTFSKYVEVNFMSAIYFLWYLKQMKGFAELCGYEKDAAEYGENFKYYKSKFDGKYFRPATRTYGNGSQTELSVAATVFDDDEELRRHWMALANKDVIEKNYHMTCGNLGYRHLIYNLAEYGYSDTVVKLLTNAEYPGWGYMLACGATTVWERWENKANGDMHSYDHPMFSAYDGFFLSYLLGIRADLSSGGFKDIVIKPCFPDSIGHCKGGIDTLRGRIDVAWEKTGGGINLEIAVPANTTLTVIAEGREITHQNGKHKGSITLPGGKFTLTLK